TRNVGRGVEISHLCGDGVDQAGRNLVAGRAGGLDSTRVGGLRIAAGIAEKWSANNVALDIGSGAVRVIQLGYAEERLGEVPGSLGRGRHRSQEGETLEAALALIIQEEERLVLLNGTAQRAAELVLFELPAIGRKEVARVERGVAQELKQGAVKIVGSVLGG